MQQPFPQPAHFPPREPAAEDPHARQTSENLLTVRSVLQTFCSVRFLGGGS